jgi:hypothetical protein
MTWREFVAHFGMVFQDKLSSNSVVIVSGTAAKREPAKDNTRLALSPRQWNEPSPRSNPQSDITSEEHLKILLRILSYKLLSKYVPYFTPGNVRYIFTLNQSKKCTAHDHLVQRFGELFFWYEDTRNTSGQYWVLHSAEYLGITYDVCRFVSTCKLPFEDLIDTSHYHDQEENGDCI